MKCPQCEEELKQTKIDEVGINECIRCKDMWFDHGHLDATKDKVLPEMGWLDVDAWNERAEFEARREMTSVRNV